MGEEALDVLLGVVDAECVRAVEIHDVATAHRMMRRHAHHAGHPCPTRRAALDILIAEHHLVSAQGYDGHR